MNVELVVSVTSAIVALFALFLSLFEGRQSRRHARLSVRPVLDFKIHVTNKTGRFDVSVSNNGFGPAVVRSWTLLVDGKPYRELGITDWMELTAHFGWDKLMAQGERVSYSYFEKGDVLAMQQQEELVGFPCPTYSTAAADAFRSGVRRLKVLICYESLYHERFTAVFDGATYF